MSDTPFDETTLPDDFACPVDPEELHLPDLYVALEANLLAPGDGIITDRHHASADNYEADDPMNQIGGQISPFALSGWLRHGCERVLQQRDATACHPGESSASFKLEDVYERDLEAGYHEKGSCVDADRPAGCLIHDLFGGFSGRAGRLIRRPIPFSPVRSQVDITDGEAEAHYRQLATHVRSRNDEDDGTPLRAVTRDAVGNLDGAWWLTVRDLKPEYIGLLCAAISLLNDNNDAYRFQLGGARNFGAGIVDAQVLNPLYTDKEIRRVDHRRWNATSAMEEKDETWSEELRPAFIDALDARIAHDTEGA